MSILYDEIKYLKNKDITYIKNYIYGFVSNLVDRDQIVEECFNSLKKYYIIKSDKFIQEIIVGLIWDDISDQLSSFIRNENYHKISILCDEMGLNITNVEIIGNHPGDIRENLYKYLER